VKHRQISETGDVAGKIGVIAGDDAKGDGGVDALRFKLVNEAFAVFDRIDAPGDEGEEAPPW
jgi:hypothetical protein